MRGFTRALGVRCSHCHVGEEGKPLSTYDFASDDNPNKGTTREMMNMLGSINEHLDYIEVTGARSTKSKCQGYARKIEGMIISTHKNLVG